jgi:hypothetical protein
MVSYYFNNVLQPDWYSSVIFGNQNGRKPDDFMYRLFAPHTRTSSFHPVIYIPSLYTIGADLWNMRDMRTSTMWPTRGREMDSNELGFTSHRNWKWSVLHRLIVDPGILFPPHQVDYDDWLFQHIPATWLILDNDLQKWRPHWIKRARSRPLLICFAQVECGSRNIVSTSSNRVHGVIISTYSCNLTDIWQWWKTNDTQRGLFESSRNLAIWG